MKEAEVIAKSVFKKHVAHLEDKLKANRKRFVLHSGPKDIGWSFSFSVFPKDQPFTKGLDDDPSNYAKDWITVHIDSAGTADLREVANLDDLLKT